MLFLMNDLKPAQRIEIKYSKDIYLLTFDDDLISLETGKKVGTIDSKFRDILKITDKQGNILAINKNGKLEKYDPLLHDDKILKIKRENRLITYDEMITEFEKKQIMINIGLLNYQKIASQKLLGVENNIRTFTTEAKTQSNEQINITRYEILKDNFLYKYDLTHSLF
jgi:hypothetical protein